MIKEDFITFGRTRVYFIDQDFNIDTGIISGILGLGLTVVPDSLNGVPLVTYNPPVEIEDQQRQDINNEEEEVGYYITHKIPNTKNEYEYLYILRRHFYFTQDIAKDILIIMLKQELSKYQGA